MNKQEIYKFIDQNGIPFKRKSLLLSSTFDSTLHLNTNKYPKQEIVIKLPFDLTEQEQNHIALDYIYDLTTFKFESINDLLSQKSLNNLPFILEVNEYDDSRLCIAFKQIPGTVVIRGDTQYKDNGHKIKSLGNIETIKGDLGLSNSAIENLGNLKTVEGDFWFSATDEFLLNNGFKILTLSPLEKVKGAISIRGKSLKTLGSLKYVGGNLLVSKYNLENYDFSKIQVSGKIRRYNDKVHNLNPT